jgi:bifunctional non-homologous end joining protein LigD
LGSLASYRAKRRFQKTPEPRGKVARASGDLRFVVQKHQATRLHYDFRLELDGVLKSWAVPKGPSMNPGDKRLAMMVEDHPLDYRDFEGVIPEGNYGAGTVIVWDNGTYHAVGAADRKDSERILRDQLERGDVKFVLHGHKLRGEFALVKMRQAEKNAWLLIKKRDRETTIQQPLGEQSVLSGRTLDEIGNEPKRFWRSTRGGSKMDLDDAPKGKMPHNVKPMLATLVDDAFDRPGWFFEVKWDGYRAIAEIGDKGVRLYSRNRKSFVDQYPLLVKALNQFGHEAVLDGEIVVLDEEGKSHFQLLQNYGNTRSDRLVYYVFDLLYLDGHDLRSLPLRRRKEILAEVIGRRAAVRLSEHIEEEGKAFFDVAARQGLEGIIAKDADSKYREGVRSREWLKIKTRLRQEAVIGGFTEPRGSRNDLGALLLGVYEDGDFVYIGHTGGGFDRRTLTDVHNRLKPLEQDECPFRDRPSPNAPIHWVKPEVICEVQFQEWTSEGHMRQPIFLGFRHDKPASAVRRELPKHVSSAAKSGETKSGKTSRAKRSAGATGSKGKSENSGSDTLRVTNLDKVFWPDEGYTKGDLIEYYRSVASVMVPYLRDRPESLNRHPNGWTGKNFFQKDVSRQPPPPGIETAVIRSDSSGEIRYIVCQDERTLIYLANLGCIEINPWNSRVQSPDQPDYLIIDLDPQEVPMPKVAEAAQAVRKLLDSADVACHCKTSGKRGLHIYVPLAARYDYDQARQFAELIATLVNRQLPDFTSVIRSPAKRRSRIYLDYLQNSRGQTLAAAYSARPYAGATVSTPLRWSEVNARLDPGKFTIRTMPRRLNRLGDIWEPVIGPGADLADAVQKLSARRG